MASCGKTRPGVRKERENPPIVCESSLAWSRAVAGRLIQVNAFIWVGGSRRRRRRGFAVGRAYGSVTVISTVSVTTTVSVFVFLFVDSVTTCVTVTGWVTTCVWVTGWNRVTTCV